MTMYVHNKDRRCQRNAAEENDEHIVNSCTSIKTHLYVDNVNKTNIGRHDYFKHLNRALQSAVQESEYYSTEP